MLTTAQKKQRRISLREGRPARDAGVRDHDVEPGEEVGVGPRVGGFLTGVDLFDADLDVFTNQSPDLAARYEQS